MTRLSILIAVFVVLFGCSTFAQVNTEALRKQFTNDTIINSLSVSYQIAQGNSEYVGLSGGYRLDCFYDHFYSFITSSLEYKKAQEKSIVDKAFAHLRLGYNINKLIGAELFFQKEFNKFILLKDRNLVGGGLRLNLHHLLSDSSQRNFELTLGSGLMAENELLNFGKDSTANTIRTTNYITYNHKFSDIISFSTIFYYQASISNFQNFRVLNDTKLNLKVTKYLSFFISFNYRYDNTAHFDLKKYDTNLLNGLSVSF